MNGALFIQADARRLPLAARSVHCIIGSPPYWGLRDYGLEPSVWGGSDTCAHEWIDTTYRDSRKNDDTAGPKQRSNNGATGWRNGDRPCGTCSKCSAWLGCLGLEPTPELFIEHLVIVYREAWRVLRDDGTLWLNIGDSYAASGRGGNPTADSSTLQGGQLSQQASIIGRTMQRGSLLPAGLHENARQAGQIGRAWCPPPAGLKQKDLVGIPWMLAFALRADGWYLRQEIIWGKPNPMPESVRDRCTKAHESVFLLTKSERYFYDADAIREPVTSTGGASFGKQDHDAAGTLAQSRKLRDPSERNNPLGRNKRSVWMIPTQSCPEAHFATFPKKLVAPMVKAGTSEKGCCPACGAPWKRVVERVPMVVKSGPKAGGYGSRTTDGLSGTMVEPPRIVTTHWLPSCKCPAHEPIPCTVLDNFSGAGTTAIVADHLGRRGIGIEPKREYIDISLRRLAHDRERRLEKKRQKRARRPTGELTLFGLEERS